MKWKTVKYPKELSDLEITKYGDIRRKSDKVELPLHYNYKGYLVLYYNNKDYKVHRMVAGTFCGKLTDKLEVHHIDGNRANPRWDNLLICTHAEHMKIHHSTAEDIEYIKPAPGTTVLTEDQVHEICKMLELGYSRKKIRYELKLYNVSISCLNAIAQGKIWEHISSQYDIKTKTFSCTNSYTKDAKQIGIMMYNGMSIKDIARRLGVNITNKTEYDRLYKCAKRYKRYFIEGKWGSLDNYRLGKG